MAVAERKWSARAFWPRGRALALGVLTLATPAWAQLPDYHLELQVRTNLLGNASGAYNVGPGNLLSGSYQIPISADGQIAFRLAITPEGRSAVWWGHGGMGSRIYLLPQLGEDARTGDPGVNSQGDIAFAVTWASPATQNGIYLLNVASPEQVRIIRGPPGASDWSSLWLNEAGQIGFRATYSGVGRAYAIANERPDGTFSTTIVAAEQTVDPGSPYQFLYSPTLNDLGQMAGVGDVATASSEFFQDLRIFEPDGMSSRLIAQSRGRDATSPVYRFASVAPALNNMGQVAFLGTARNAQSGNVTTLWLWDGAALRVLAQDGVGDIRTLEFFAPDINDTGWVVFRAIDSANMRAVWVSDGQSLKRVATEHDIVSSDLGPARIDQETPSNPVFGGLVSINGRGEISLAAGLAPPDNDQVEWGTAVFIARPVVPQQDGGTGGPDGGPGPGVDGGVDGGPGEPDSGVDGGPGPGVDGGPGEPDSGVDGGPGPGVDGGVDGGPGEPDSGVDGGPGPGVDGGVDGGPGEPDSGVDGGPGPGVDGGPGEPDSGVDGGPGPGVDGGPGEPDAGVDGGPGPGVDGGSGDPDAGADGGPGPIVDGGAGEDPDAGTDPDAGSGEDPDAGPGTENDAGPGEEPGADAGSGEEPQSDAGADAGPGQPQDSGTSPPPPPADSGCGCQSSSPSAALPWMLVGLMRAVIGRRRKAE
ncbi:hypothetical protein A176_007018 [Myxococcus hansupus]|uniref:Uncharacterized protein n=1 Tax=Pseudomyxococcus hansupus TaxID=1297742 RepID=A0A0H4X385_9BACT|nr:MXAN_5453 family MXYO-CTERM-anchored protein [Myxococcus hansupus]AKQ70106.1 hypothetical protein A176_007018 [Myxococcus hansupus]